MRLDLSKYNRYFYREDGQDEIIQKFGALI